MSSSNTTWILVADEAIARVLAVPDRGVALEPVHALTDPAAHARGADLRRDAVGRRRGAGGATRSHATGSAGDADVQHERREAEHFAKEVASWLHQARSAGRFDALHIAAAPRFLGMLRKALSGATAACVVQAVSKDWIHDDDATLAQRFFP